MEGRRLDDGRCVLGIRAGVQVALAVGLLGADQRHVGHQVDEHPCIEFDIGVDGPDFQLPVFEELRQANALRTGEREIELASDAPLEQRQMFRPADASDQEMQVMELRRVGLDECPGEEIRLLLVVTLQCHVVTGLDQRLQRLDGRSGLQDTPVHPARDPGQPRGLLHPAPRPAVRQPFRPDARTHFDVPKNTRRHRPVTILTSGCADFEADCERPGG